MDEADLSLLAQLMDAKDPRAQQIFRKMTSDEASQFMVWRQKSQQPKHLIDLAEQSDMPNPLEHFMPVPMGLGIAGEGAALGRAAAGGDPPNLLRGGPSTQSRAPRKPGMIGTSAWKGAGPIEYHTEPAFPPKNLIQGGMDEADKRSILFGGAGDRSRPQLRTPISRASINPNPYPAAVRPRKPAR